ncbi:MAG: hypothetical protein ACI9DC_002016 [Gammaproteobacteria bacterium]|jgi:hypothetical protein
MRDTVTFQFVRHSCAHKSKDERANQVLARGARVLMILS